MLALPVYTIIYEKQLHEKMLLFTCLFMFGTSLVRPHYLYWVYTCHAVINNIFIKNAIP